MYRVFQEILPIKNAYNFGTAWGIAMVSALKDAQSLPVLVAIKKNPDSFWEIGDIDKIETHDLFDNNEQPMKQR
jgi:hypothetical protein